MFKDALNHNYLELNDYKNIVIEYDKSRVLDAAKTYITHPTLLELFNKLTRERPTWQFKAMLPYARGPGVVHVRKFEVYDNDLPIGTVFWENNYSSNTKGHIHYNNHRLAAARERGNSNYTSKVDVAAKKILKMFHSKTRKERGKDAFDSTKAGIQKVVGNTTWKFRRKYQPVENYLTKYVIDNWDTVSKYLATLGVTADPDAPAVFDAQEVMKRINSAIENAKGVSVVAEGTEYLVNREYANDRSVEVFTTETLSDHLKTGLGILKMLDPHTPIDGVGMRIDHNTFFILDAKEA